MLENLYWYYISKKGDITIETIIIFIIGLIVFIIVAFYFYNSYSSGSNNIYKTGNNIINLSNE